MPGREHVWSGLATRQQNRTPRLGDGEAHAIWPACRIRRPYERELLDSLLPVAKVEFQLAAGALGNDGQLFTNLLIRELSLL